MATFGDSGTLGGNSRLPLPESFDGTMQKWEDWPWHVRSYVSMFKEHVPRVMDAAEEATSVITDDAVQTIEDNAVELTGLVAFSRQLHYLLSLITKNSARLVVPGNLGLNGFETWRLLSRRFALPSTANNISLLTKVLEFFSITPFSAMSIWSRKSFVVGRLFLYWSVSRFARKSKAKSKSKSRGETGDVWRGCVQVQKIAQEGGFPIPSCFDSGLNTLNRTTLSGNN